MVSCSCPCYVPPWTFHTHPVALSLAFAVLLILIIGLPWLGKRWIDKQYEAAEREQELARKRLWPDA